MKTLRTLLLAAAFAISAMATATPYLDGSDAGEKSKEAKERLVEREEELYDDGTDLLDEHEWRKAAAAFDRVYQMKMSHADGALYWRAWAQKQMGQRAEALASIAELRQTFPHSRWIEDAQALEVEVRQQAGQSIEPERVDDEELKLMALNALMHSEPDRAIPIVETVLKNPKSSKKIKDKAIFVLSQTSSPQAFEILGRIAKDNGNRDLQASALRYLGIMGGDRSRVVLADVYSSSNDVRIKKSVLRSYMIAGDRDHLLVTAKAEKDPDLRGEAIRQLGIIGARAELADLYSVETTKSIKKSIIQAMFIGGNADKLGELARNEKDPELRSAAIRNLGLLGGTKSGQLLLSIYQTDPSRDVRTAVIHSLFLQGNAKTLVDLARGEKDPELKKEIISKLSIMGSKEATDYLMEYLKD
ncbi:MAG TPA: HEAT repeat domain-containing protein [Thermoanaerobaculia bacterium]|jgi:HEAT repeat protein|nr:HEAT repeat domain-containing protein [Thermoanaerobaculia bacterium]